MDKHNGQVDLSDFYWSLGDAVVELEKRRKSPSLQQEVREQVHLTTELEVLFERPHLVMFRQVLTPLNEILLCFELAKKYNLTPFVIEYYDDKFVSTGNQFKRDLGKLPIHKFTAPNGHLAFEYATVVDFNTFVGQPLRSVETVKGESLTDFHHELFFSATNIQPLLISRDGSKWFKSFANSHEYYEPFLKLFLRDAILFETFITNASEEKFFNEVVYFAYKKIHNDFSYRPLIVETESDKGGEYDPTVDLYPTTVSEILAQKGYI